MVDVFWANGIELFNAVRSAAAADAEYGSNERLRRPIRHTPDARAMMIVYALYAVAALLALSPIAIALGVAPRGASAATIWSMAHA